MTVREDIAVVESILDAFGRGDIAGVLEHFHDDVVVNEASSLPFGGEHRGRTAFTTMLETLADTFEVEASPTSLAHVGDAVMLRMAPRFRSRRTGRSVVMQTIELFTLRETKVVRIDVFYKDTAAMIAVFTPS